MLNIIIILSVLFSSSSQLLLKKGANLLDIPTVIDARGVFKLSISIMTNPYLIVGVLFQVLALLIWIYVLKKVDVSYAYPFISLGFIFVISAGYFIFNEPVNLWKIIGVLMITIGVIMIGKS